MRKSDFAEIIMTLLKEDEARQINAPNPLLRPMQVTISLNRFEEDKKSAWKVTVNMSTRMEQIAEFHFHEPMVLPDMTSMVIALQREARSAADD
tara:strand:+ start:508 stop:789 length:282 start_codon:yes stop_codon:yes gene_type:complete